MSVVELLKNVVKESKEQDYNPINVLGTKFWVDPFSPLKTYSIEVLEKIIERFENEQNKSLCTIDVDKRGIMTCSNCGEEISWFDCDIYSDDKQEYSHNYCYNCGAKVIKDVQ